MRYQLATPLCCLSICISQGIKAFNPRVPHYNSHLLWSRWIFNFLWEMRPADGNCGGNEFRSSPYLMRFAFSAETPEFLPLKLLCLSPVPLLQRAHRQFGARDPNVHMAVRFYHLFVGLTEPLKCIYRGLYSLNEHPGHQTYIRNLNLEVVDRSRFIRWLMLRLAWFARPPEIKKLVKNQIKKNQTHFPYHRPAPLVAFYFDQLLRTWTIDRWDYKSDDSPFLRFCMYNSMLLSH